MRNVSTLSPLGFSVCIIYYYIFVFCFVQTLPNIKKFFRIWGLNWVQLENTFFLAINSRLSGFEYFLSLLVFALGIVK